MGVLRAEGTDPRTGPYDVRYGQAGASAYGLSVSAVSSAFAVSDVIENVSGATIEVTASTGIMGETDTDDVADIDIQPTPTTAVVSIAVGGTWSLSVDVEEWCRVEQAVTGSRTAPDAFGFPGHGGTAARHGLGSTICYFFEKTRIGGAKIATIDVGSVAATATEAITFEEPIVGYAVSVSTQASEDGTGNGCVWKITSTTGGVPGYIHTLNEPLPSGAVIGIVDGSAGAYAHVTGVGGDSATCTSTVTPPLRYDLGLRARAMKTQYGANVTWDYLARRGADGSDLWQSVTGTPDATIEVVQRRHSAGGQAMRSGVAEVAAPTVAVDEFAPMIVRLPVSWLASRGEDERDWRCQIRGWTWPVLEDVVHADSVSVPIGALDDWTAGANTTATAPGGVIRLAVAGGSGGATRAFSPKANLEGYRYLRIRVRSTVGASKPMRLAIGSKWWDLATSGAGSWVEVDLDLCSPGSETADTDGQSSRYPVEAPDGTDPGAPLSDGPYWGVSRASSIVLSQLEDGETYEIQAIEIRRSSWSRATVSHAYTWRPAWTSGSDETSVDQLVYLCSDGRLLDVPAMAFVDVSGTDYYARFTIAELRDQWQTFPGWTMSLAPALSDGYHDTDLEAALLQGGGSWIDHATGVWSDSWELSCTSARDLVAQDLWDELNIYPGCGNPFTLAAYDWALATPVRVSKTLRSGARGIVLRQATGEPLEGATVSLQATVGATAAGSAVSGALGAYRTGSPWAKAPISHDLKQALNTIVDTYENRRWIRGAFRGSLPPSGGVHRFSNWVDGFTFDARFGEAGLTLTRRSAWGIDDFAIIDGVQIASAQGCWDPVDRALRIAYVVSGESDVRLLVCRGDETNWEDVGVIADGTIACIAADPRGDGLVLGAYDAGTWRFYRLNRATRAFGAVGTVAGAEEAPAGLAFETAFRRELIFAYPVAGGIDAKTSVDVASTWEALI